MKGKEDEERSRKESKDRRSTCVAELGLALGMVVQGHAHVLHGVKKRMM